MNWPLAIRSLLMGIILGIAGVSVRDWKGWFAIIALNLINLIH